MANYPAPPQHRMAYDRDGTQGLLTTNNWATVARDLTTTEMQDLNSEALSVAVPGSGSPASVGIALIFPELRDLDAALGIIQGNADFGTKICEVSSDTTNGVDGTWTAITSFIVRGGTRETMRESITAQTSLGIRAVRIWCSVNQLGTTANAQNIHLYGEIAPGQNPDRLVVWDPTLDQVALPAIFDFEDNPRSSSEDRTFRIKNISSTKTAFGIRVAMETLTDSTPSFVGQHMLSEDGATFLAQVDIGDLAPGAISPVLTLRQSLATNATLSLWWMRVFAEATSWA